MNKEYLLINSRDEILRLDISRLVYIEADGNYTNFISANKLKGTVCMTLARAQELISTRMGDRANCFARIGKRHIINLNYVHSINTLRQKLVLSDDHTFAFQLDVSKEALKSLKTILIDSALTNNGNFNRS